MSALVTSVTTKLLYKLLKRFEVEKRGETNPNLPSCH